MLQKKWLSEPGRVHGIIYRPAFGESLNDVKAVGKGFGIIDGEFKITSGALNPSHGDDYHDNGALMNEDSARFVGALVKIWKDAGPNCGAEVLRRFAVAFTAVVWPRHARRCLARSNNDCDQPGLRLIIRPPKYSNTQIFRYFGVHFTFGLPDCVFRYDIAKSRQDLTEILPRSCQDLGKVLLWFRQDLSKILPRSCQDSAKILARSRQDLGPGERGVLP